MSTCYLAAISLGLPLLAATTPAGQRARWRTFKPSEGNVTILMPGAPEYKRQRNNGGGRPTYSHRYIADGDRHVFWLVVSDLPPISRSEWGRVERGEPDAVRLLVKTAGSVSRKEWGEARLLQSKFLRHGKLAGAECRLVTTDEEAFAIRARVLFSRRHAYLLFALGQKGEDNAQEVKTFFDSLRVVSPEDED